MLIDSSILRFFQRSEKGLFVLVMAEPKQIAAECMVEFHTCAKQIPEHRGVRWWR